ncbi:hypothetical protein Glove_28g46 [Diversispora epigaea]|uniref:Uncharacterized protein n=1 Tax=Diversispora epigaea TaxID=1348612 RepID=A0A397JHW3_9GLOM|nr:hypothetical protein Glove_28g46 [Diversispora epigaea]
MKVMVFVVDNLYEENKNNVEDFVENRKLSEVYAKWNKMYMMSRSEIFTESDLENFQIYHIFKSIRQFGAINGYTTETYESLHKDFVKIPYRMSNKKNVKQDDYRSMWGYVQKYVQNTRSIKGTSYSLRFLQKVVTRELADQIMDDIFNQFKLFLHTHIWKNRCTAVKKWETENGISNNKWKKKVRNETLDTTVISQTNNTDNNSVLNNTTQGFDQFLECFDDFLENILEIKDIKECDIIIYSTATLENGSIIRAKNKFHDKPWFSNVAISMDSNESSDYQSDKVYMSSKLIWS